MRPFANVLCMICASVLLGACSYFDTGEGPDVATQDRQSVDLMRGPPERLDSADLANIVNGASGGSVTVFSLDGPITAPPGSAGMPDRPVNTVHAFDPSVEVFPLDEGMRGLIDLPASGATVSGPLAPSPFEAEPLLQDYQGDSQQGAVMGGPVSVYFGHDSDSLDAEAARIVSGVSKSYKKGDGLSVEGHASIRANYADEIQKRIVNLRVSMNRAVAVAARLIAGGVPPDSIQTVAWGDTKPGGGVAGMDSEAASRRVDIFTQSLQ